MSDDYSTPPFSPVARVANAANQADSDGASSTKSKSSLRNVSFMPAAAIAYLGQSNRTAEEDRTVIRVRLGQLAVIYVLLFGMTLILRPFLLGLIDPVIATVAGILFALFLGLTLVSSWRPAIPVGGVALPRAGDDRVVGRAAGALPLSPAGRAVAGRRSGDGTAGGKELGAAVFDFNSVSRDLRSQEFSPRPGGWRAAGAFVADHGSGQLSGASRRAELGRPAARRA